MCHSCERFSAVPVKVFFLAKNPAKNLRLYSAWEGGDSESKEAIVVDPGGDVDKIVAKLRAHNLSCKRILITHGHLDHIIGTPQGTPGHTGY
eukprot:Skav236412  [mRNA]  locus=scaffold4178:66941:68474:+ [translate_table: standard]